MLSQIKEARFEKLRGEIEDHPRLAGYYILGLVSIDDLRDKIGDQEEILTKVIAHFDDPKDPLPGAYQEVIWSEYETTRESARAHLTEALVGGPSIGHIRETMPKTTANGIFDQFAAICGSDTKFYIGMELGDRKHVYLYGVLFVGSHRAGIIWIVESD